MKNTIYYIATGQKSCYFTLRVEFDEWVGNYDGNRKVRRDHYIKSLSTNRAKAIEKAKAYVGKDVEIREEPMNKIGHTKRDPNTLYFGKYAGMTIQEVKEIAPDYLCWVVECGSSNESELAQNILVLMADELAKRKTERVAERRKMMAERNKNKKALAEIENRIPFGRGFCESIKKDMWNGIAPKGRGQNIVAGILAKQKGRRNSKAYNAEHDRVMGILEGLES